MDSILKLNQTPNMKKNKPSVKYSPLSSAMDLDWSDPKQQHIMDLMAIATELEALSALLAIRATDSEDLHDLFVGLSNILHHTRRNLKTKVSIVMNYDWNKPSLNKKSKK